MHYIGRLETWINAGAVWAAVLAVFFAVRDGGSPLPLAVVVLQGVVLLARRRRSVVPFLVCLAGMVLLVAVRESWAIAAGLCQLALLHLASVRARRDAVIAAGLLFLAQYAALALQPGFEYLGIAAASVLAWNLASVGTGVAVRTRGEYVAAVEERARWALESRESEARRRVAEDRLRIARDLHDVLGHQMAVIRVHAGLARRTLTTDPSKAAVALGETEAAATTVMREMTGILRLLREGDPEDTAPAPGLADLPALVGEVRRSGLPVTLGDGPPAGPVPELVGVTAYRVVQECLTNAGRYGSGAATVSLSAGAETFVIEVSNPVDGATTTGAGYGLIGMGERVRAVGGRLESGLDDRTFRVRAELPLSAGADLAVESS